MAPAGAQRAKSLTFAAALLLAALACRTGHCSIRSSSPTTETQRVNKCTSSGTLNWTGGPNKSYTFQCQTNAKLNPGTHLVFVHRDGQCTSETKELVEAVPGSFLTPNPPGLRQSLLPIAASYTLQLGDSPGEQQVFCYTCTESSTFLAKKKNVEATACNNVVTVPGRVTDTTSPEPEAPTPPLPEEPNTPDLETSTSLGSFSCTVWCSAVFSGAALFTHALW